MGGKKISEQKLKQTSDSHKSFLFLCGFDCVARYDCLENYCCSGDFFSFYCCATVKKEILMFMKMKTRAKA